MPSKLEMHSKMLLEELCVKFDTEYRFDAKRRWRFDFAYNAAKIAVEVEGGTWTGKGHAGGKHYRSDCEKYNRATQLGWKVYRFTTDMVEDGTLQKTMKEILFKQKIYG